MLEVYHDFAVNEAAVPGMQGEKSARERFAGAENTFTIDAMMGDSARAAGVHVTLSRAELRPGI